MGRTTVGIIGAGPAGLTLANLLAKTGVECVVLERHGRSYIEGRARAGVLEQRAVDMLAANGLADRLLAEAEPHGVCEFRVYGKAFTVPYGDLYEGRTHYVYPQQELVTDLVAALLDRGGDIRFDVDSVALHQIDGPRPVISWTGADGEERLECDFIAGCDGYRGVSRQSIPAGMFREYSHNPGIAWLSILAEAPPSTRAIIYALHENGFAGHMLRSKTVSRFYLQCPVSDDVRNWPDERVWAELRERLALADGSWRLTEGAIIEKRVLDMRSFVVEPMSHGRLYLLGDAAHVITPVGAKGMNLALHDAEVLANALTHWRTTGETTALDAYSEICLRRVWRCQEFSQWMTSMIHMPREDDEEHGFLGRLAMARLEHLMNSRTFASAFAENYVGLM
ncbi:p-hydroxybenzoate 3-monooxygenase [Herbihabitans rhizosphaerae]|uniref:p-hydroxybenzoate 3-monooxygenase n=1 Tax=Herbihabitans rhizosphaerae TaxID=1872711 RepID=A0A4V2ETH1_9PSEU|nr:4-hydroxybenzoate 3-monooxygenase [Herbihabitans rhizosphaerae]RZS41053.1 p-hydroxybenzoate 3-monooxygenase [Herbihabitans rhizosphaerae]